MRGRLTARERADLERRHLLRRSDDHLSDEVPKEGTRSKDKPLRSRLAENIRAMLWTKASAKDNARALVGGVMYVMVPTLVQLGTGADLTGWRGFGLSVGLNVLAGALMRSPGYMAGALGAAAAHLVYARGQDYVLQPMLKTWAYRFDPTITTSSMSDSGLPVGTEERTIAGERVMLYPPSPAAPRVAMERRLPDGDVSASPSATAAMQRATGQDTRALPMPRAEEGTLLQENFSPTLQENFSQTLQENFSQTLRENYARTLEQGMSHGDRERLRRALDDNFSQTLQDAYGAWGASTKHALEWK